MKRVICLLLVVFGGLLANPVVPGFGMSELKFDDQNNWKLEIEKPSYINAQAVDSVILRCYAGSTRVKNSAFTTDSTFFVVENSLDYINRLVDIDRNGDIISIDTYYSTSNGQPTGSCFCFNSSTEFADLQPGQSVAFIDGVIFMMYGYAIDNTPNFGSRNREDGAVGQLKGLLIDQNGNPLANTNFNGHGFYAITDNTGHYTINLLAKRHTISSISITNPYNFSAIFEPDIIIPIKPDSVTNFDFNLSVLDINEQPSATKSSALLYNYPNPFNNQTAIYYEVPEGLKYKNAAIRISNIKGEAVAVLAADQKSGSVYWNADHNSAGMYIYQLLIDGKAVKSGEMVLLK